MTDERLGHGLVGNGRVLGLVHPSTAIEWLCMPRFDSPSVFGRLLDAKQGGVFRFLLDGQEIVGDSSYVTNTNVLRTVVSSTSGTFEVLDFAPRYRAAREIRAPIELVRLLRPLEGSPRVTVDFDPRPDFSLAPVSLHDEGGAITVRGGTGPFHLATNVPVSFVLGKTPFTLRDPVFFSFSCGTRPTESALPSVHRALEETIFGWRAWAKTCALPTFAPNAVLRSALCMKLHVYEDTGAIIAATTTSIPEALGTQRCWDYRYCWLRDAAFVVEALRRLSHLAEGERFIRFLRHVAESGPLQPLYGIGGERMLDERILAHLAGFEGNHLVRVGNAAYLQQQNDLHGELLLCLETLLTDPRIVVEDASSYLPIVERLVEEAIVLADKPDTGIWEFRALPRSYTFSRAMCWVAADRGAELVAALGRPDLAARYQATASAEKELILQRGYSRELGFFTQALDGTFPDAANLLLPTLGIVDARDPRFLSTLDAYEKRMVHNGFMLRYVNDDDFGETTSAFLMCSFWWAEALALAGRLEQAIEVFDRAASVANPLGLFSEDVVPATGRLLGNFPQAYTHVGLVHAAMTISELLEARDGRVRAWS